MHQNPANIRVLPKGSIVAGLRRGRNLGEIIAPTKPQRERRVEEVGGSGACDSSRCTLHQSGAVQECQEQEGRTGVLQRRVTCSSRDPVYYILCPCGHMSDYVGSTTALI